LEEHCPKHLDKEAMDERKRRQEVRIVAAVDFEAFIFSCAKPGRKQTAVDFEAFVLSAAQSPEKSDGLVVSSKVYAQTVNWKEVDGLVVSSKVYAQTVNWKEVGGGGGVLSSDYCGCELVLPWKYENSLGSQNIGRLVYERDWYGSI
jgi:hypothetical protein